MGEAGLISIFIGKVEISNHVTYVVLEGSLGEFKFALVGKLKTVVGGGARKGKQCR